MCRRWSDRRKGYRRTTQKLHGSPCHVYFVLLVFSLLLSLNVLRARFRILLRRCALMLIYSCRNVSNVHSPSTKTATMNRLASSTYKYILFLLERLLQSSKDINTRSSVQKAQTSPYPSTAARSAYCHRPFSCSIPHRVPFVKLTFPRRTGTIEPAQHHSETKEVVLCS